MPATADVKKKGERNDGPKEIEVGQRWRVIWRDGSPHLAEIVERRPIAKSAAEGGSSTSGSAGGSSASAAVWNHEYYVHYIDYDRRLDEWVGADRMDLAAGEQRSTLPQNGDAGGKRRLTRQKRKYDEIGAKAGHGSKTSGDGAVAGVSADLRLALLEREHEEITKVKNIQVVELGRYEIETWYYSPYPDDYSRLDRLYVCEFCLKYMRKKATFERHRVKCERRAPPGDEMYRDGNVAMFEVDGRSAKVYCQNLCLLSKLFLDHKTLYYDVNPFLFYVLCETDSDGAHMVGYFSKEKQSPEEYNLACILTFPPYQRKGYGKLLISLSYELTKRENTVGSPEKPLSDLGKLSYRSYWAFVLLTLLRSCRGSEGLSMREMSRRTGIKVEDIISTLQSLGLIRYWKGQHVLAVSQRALEQHLAETRPVRLAKPECLNWEPPADKKTASRR